MNHNSLIQLLTCSVCQDLSLNATKVAGKVVICFASVTRRVAIKTAASIVQEAGGIGLIVAKNPTDTFSPCAENFPCVEVDYEVGTQLLFYIRSTE